jgi:superfamily I DNA/RNA helicase
VVDFREAKGLEKEVVIVHGIEELYRKSENEMLFGDSTAYRKTKRRLRRILYVALTRALEKLFLFYHDGQMPVIRELIELSDRIRETELA